MSVMLNWGWDVCRTSCSGAPCQRLFWTKCWHSPECLWIWRYSWGRPRLAKCLHLILRCSSSMICSTEWQSLALAFTKPFYRLGYCTNGAEWYVCRSWIPWTSVALENLHCLLRGCSRFCITMQGAASWVLGQETRMYSYKDIYPFLAW